ncbi:MAG: radical SAM protein [Desulfobacterales bacterium]
MSLIVNEIFYSIQGESIYSGRPCIFVRLTGCNLRCTYCDTQYAYEAGEKMEITQIINRVAGYNCRLIEITGGEPLLQDETPLLISKLLDNGYAVMMETNGSLDISRVDRRCIKILDVKCPSSNSATMKTICMPKASFHPIARIFPGITFFFLLFTEKCRQRSLRIGYLKTT